jgi:hypothetical protein
MLNAWFYSHPTWQVTLAVCTSVIVLSLAVLFVFHRLVGWETRERDTTMVGLSYALAGGLYAIVISFVAVGVYEAMDRGEAIAAGEANSLASLVFDSAGLPAALGAKLRHDLGAYVDTVTKTEWPDQQAYRMEDKNFDRGWAQLRRISLDLSTFDPPTMGQATVKGEMIQTVGDLFSERRARLLAAKAHLPDAVWQMMIGGLILVIVYVCLFGPHSFKMHLATTALTAMTIGLVFSLIIGLDYPFRGDLSVDDDAYVGVGKSAAALFGGGEHKTAAEAKAPA